LKIGNQYKARELCDYLARLKKIIDDGFFSTTPIHRLGLEVKLLMFRDISSIEIDKTLSEYIKECVKKRALEIEKEIELL